MADQREGTEAIAKDGSKADSHSLLSLSLAEQKQYHAKLGNETHIGYIEMMLPNYIMTKKVKKTKMLVVGAENDKVVSKKDTEKTAKTYAASFVMIPDIAHGVMLDTNWRAAAKSMEEWLETSL